MRTITKDVTLAVDGEKKTFRITKLDAMSGVSLLRLLIRAQETKPDLTVLDFISLLPEEDLHSVMKSVFNHIEVLLPAGPNPLMTEGEWSYPEIRYDMPLCMRLLLEGISWNLSGFFAGSGRNSPPAKDPAAP